jgi:hypothetical protein
MRHHEPMSAFRPRRSARGDSLQVAFKWSSRLQVARASSKMLAEPLFQNIIQMEQVGDAILEHGVHRQFSGSPL